MHTKQIEAKREQQLETKLFEHEQPVLWKGQHCEEFCIVGEVENAIWSQNKQFIFLKIYFGHRP